MQITVTVPSVKCSRCGLEAPLQPKSVRADAPASPKGLEQFSAVDDAGGVWRVAVAERPVDWVAGPTGGSDINEGLCKPCGDAWVLAGKQFLSPPPPVVEPVVVAPVAAPVVIEAPVEVAPYVRRRSALRVKPEAPPLDTNVKAAEIGRQATGIPTTHVYPTVQSIPNHKPASSFNITRAAEPIAQVVQAEPVASIPSLPAPPSNAATTTVMAAPAAHRAIPNTTPAPTIMTTTYQHKAVDAKAMPAAIPLASTPVQNAVHAAQPNLPVVRPGNHVVQSTAVPVASQNKFEPQLNMPVVRPGSQGTVVASAAPVPAQNKFEPQPNLPVVRPAPPPALAQAPRAPDPVTPLLPVQRPV